MLSSLYACLLGFLLDFVIGIDPRRKFHPIKMTGRLITVLEGSFRKRFPDTNQGKLIGGLLMTCSVSLSAFLIPYLLLVLLFKVSPLAAFLLESILCCFVFSLKALKTKTVKIVELLKGKRLEESRKSLSRIDGMDTGDLSQEEIIKATVETVAENTVDGIVAPMFFMIIGGAPFALFFKAVNIMNSMVAYKNETSVNFGRYAAKLDDILKYYPARIAANLMILAAYIWKGTDGKNAKRIYIRDRLKHAGRNSAYTKAAFAGALRMELAGDFYYSGIRIKKELIGENEGEITPEKILQANKLMYTTAAISIMLLGLIKFGIIYFLFLNK